MKKAAVALSCALAASAAHAAVDQEKVDALFRAGLAAAHAGRHEIAIRDFRQILGDVSTPRLKLELARSLYLTGRFREALALFREVYEAPGTPQAVRRNILPFMEEAELRILRVRFGARVVTDTNPSKVADGGTIYFNGIPLEYQPPARRRTSYGLEPWFSVEKLWQNGLLTKFYGSTRIFENSDLDTGHIQAAVAKEMSFAPGLFLQAAVDTEISKDNSYVLPSIEVWKRFRLSDRAGVGIGGQIGYMKSEIDVASGGFYRPYVFGDWTVMPNATLFATLSAEYLDSRNDFYTYVSPKANVGATLSFSGLDVTPQLTVTRTNFKEYDVFWGLKRQDTIWRPAIAVSWDGMEWNGIRPELNIFYEKRDSNVGIYKYSQIGGFINLTQVF